MTRKSPYRHPVRNHIRSGVQVGKYIRGQGKPSIETPIQNQHHNSLWFVQWSFRDEKDEVITVNANTATNAVRKAMGIFRTPKIPYKCKVGKA